MFLSPFFLSFFIPLVRITLHAIACFHYSFLSPHPPLSLSRTQVVIDFITSLLLSVAIFEPLELWAVYRCCGRCCPCCFDDSELEEGTTTGTVSNPVRS